MSVTATAAEREQATAAARGRVEKFGLGVLMFAEDVLITRTQWSVVTSIHSEGDCSRPILNQKPSLDSNQRA
eukprot:98998-Pelagomonas_calceolata.AAC.1